MTHSRFAKFDNRNQIVKGLIEPPRTSNGFGLDENGPDRLKAAEELNRPVKQEYDLPFRVVFQKSGAERYPTYAPFVKEETVAFNGTLLGELRVSKFLLESQIKSLKVTSFRPGELSYHFRQPEALLATGYELSSSTTANNCLTHLPFQLNYSRETDAELPLFEFPVTIEDEAAPRMGTRVPQAVALAEKLRRYGGLLVVLIHPDILGHKLKFEREFVATVRPYAWLSNLRDFGGWWAARNEVSVDVSSAGGRRQMTILAPRRVAGLTVVPPPGWVIRPVKTKNVKQSGKGLLFGEIEGKVVVEF